MSGVACVVILALIRNLVMDAKNPVNAALIALPIIYGLTIFVNVLTVTLNGSKRKGHIHIYRITFTYGLFPLSVLGMEELVLWQVFAISVGALTIVCILCQLFIVPWQRKKIINVDETVVAPKMSINSNGHSVDSMFSVAASTVSINALALKENKIESDSKVNQLFHFLQILSAVFTSFAHGGSDVR